MPWTVRRSSTRNGYDIVKSDTGEVVGHSATKAEAEASVRARYANYKGGSVNETRRPPKP